MKYVPILALLASAVLFAPSSAHSSPVTYYANGTFQNGATFSGSFIFNNNDVDGTFTLSDESQIANAADSYQSTPGGEAFRFTDTDLFGFGIDQSGPTLCTTSDASFGDCGTHLGFLLQEGNYSFVNSGSISTTPPSAVTPEPCSLLLLGTGALGVFGAARRRFVKP